MGAQPSVFVHPHASPYKDSRVGLALRSGRFPPLRSEGGLLGRGALLQLLQSLDVESRAEKLQQAEEKALRERQRHAKAEPGGPSGINGPNRGDRDRDRCKNCVKRRCAAQVMRKVTQTQRQRQ